MAQKQTINTFEKGLVVDIAKAVVSKNNFIDAVNLTLADNYSYTSLVNLRGNLKVADFYTTTGSDITNKDVLGVYGMYWRNTNTNKDVICVVAFIEDLTTSDYRMYVVDTEDFTVYSIVTISYPPEAKSSDLSIDAVVFGEDGRNIMYFTDNYNPVYRVICEYPQSANVDDIRLFKLGALGSISVSSVGSGGDLMCGAYQFSYRLINKDKKKYTNFSIPTNPVMVFKEPDDTTGDLAVGDVGMVTNSKITLSIDVGSSELSDYTHYQVAVFENLDGKEYPPQTVKLLDPVALSSNPHSFEYKTNAVAATIDASEVVVDKAAISKVKTLKTINNVLLFGNIVYKSLDYDKGEPTIGSSTTFITATDSTASPEKNRTFYSQQLSASTKVGYFRGETYRFYISYFDENYNFSRPKPLDFTGTSVATSGAIDCTFPGRNDPNVSILDTNSKPQALGLQIADIDNHPTWAKGFVILRAERKKNIAFQAALVPSMLVVPSGAYGDYPGNVYDTSSGSTKATNASPPVNQSGIYIPKNFLNVVNRSIVKNTGNTMVRWEHDGDTSVTVNVTDLALVALSGNPVECYIRTSGTGVYDSFSIGQKVTVSGFTTSANNTASGEYFTITDIYNHTWASTSSLYLKRDTGSFTDETITTTITINYSSQSQTTPSGTGHVHVLYSPEFMYKDSDGVSYSSYEVSVNDEIKTVDVAFLRGNIGRYFTGSDGIGYDVDQEYYSLFYATEKQDYYYYPDTSLSAPNVDRPQASIASFDLVDTNSYTTLGANISGLYTTSFGDHDSIQPVGFTDAYPPKTQRCGVIVTKDFKDDVTTRCFNGTSGYRTSNDITSQVSHFSGIPTSYSSVNSNIAFAGQTVSDGDYLGAVEIVNVERGLGGDRYGGAEDTHNVYYTGTFHRFTASELNNVKNGVSTPITVDVWGGDCRVVLCTFKVSDSHYIITSTTTNQTDATNRFSSSFNVNPGGAYGEVSRPVSLKGGHQSISLYLESEVNADVLPRISFTDTTIGGNKRIPAPSSTVGASTRAPFDYLYLFPLSAENKNKLFVPYNSFEKNLTKYRSRVLYSDTKVYQSDIEGFDLVKALNYYDLDESYGAVTKLVRIGANMFAIQEYGIAYLPIQASVIQTDDTAVLSVRDKDFIGLPKYVSVLYGSRHIRTILEIPGGVIFFDDLNNALRLLSGTDTKDISELGVISDFNTKYSGLTDNQLFAFHDIANKKYKIVATDKTNGSSIAYVYNYRLGLWEPKENYGKGRLLGAANFDGTTYHVGYKDELNGSMSIYQDNAGTYNEFFGDKVTPYVTVVVNDDKEITKIFDNLRIYSDSSLNEVIVFVERLDRSENQRTFGIKIANKVREEYYRLKVLRDSAGRRLRGSKAEITVKWDEDLDKAVILNSIMTKYRLSTKVV